VAAVSPPGPVNGRRIRIRGIVQGVGFRPWVYRLALAHGVGGWVRNDASGVTIEAYGPHAALEAFVGALQEAPPSAARIAEWHSEPIAGRDLAAVGRSCQGPRCAGPLA